ncbi:hypothetical protein [Herminiimonas fonticola]|uniref:Uncharacterized protein n=1 Tax=Herminiimonas fonticola TaxID=303380 RepID=A0A4R6G5S0_9BURK|nr:hypothetical protein [Herminiimonas fonticola]RBA23814.1 hypothetical protein Hfont_1626 [Herminiimonas fonticola]TDN89816.1 hypothetical protein EV677_1878 [Herminiimonas fonticola]
MSILHTTLQDASTLFKGNVTVEWPAYIKACRQIAEKKTDPVEVVLRQKRSQALKYLCNNTPATGPAYSLTEPRIFTPQFISELGAANSRLRAKRNPWVEAMLKEMREKSVWPLVADRKNFRSFGPPIAVPEQSSISESVRSSA